jgi:hypothetical protein
MSPAELIHLIETAGGKLVPQSDGRLLCERVPRELRPELKLRKIEIMTLLRERAAAAPAQPFVYRPRTDAENYARQRQSEDRVPPVVVVEVRPKPRKPSASASHVTKGTPCAGCHHDHDSHCESGRLHFDSADADRPWSCIMQHCLGNILVDGRIEPCPCGQFVNPFNGCVTTWKRSVKETTPCARPGCGHPKKHHCRKGAVGIMVDGTPFACRHYMTWLALGVSTVEIEPCCDNTSCAEVDEQKNFCICSRFVSPYTRRRAARKKKAATIAMPLFPLVAEEGAIRL